MIALAAALAMAGCSSDEEALNLGSNDENTEQGSKAETESGEDTTDSSDSDYVTAADFSTKVVGSGWMHVSSYEVKADGSLEEQEYYAELCGAGPSTYYFKNDSTLVQYFWADWYPADMYRESPMTYEPETGELWLSKWPNWKLDNHWEFIMLSVDEDTFTAYEWMGVRGNNENVISYSTYRRATDAELQRIQETYTVNFNDVW